MNRVNWVQQEQDIEYHVIQWKNSHFHEHHKGRLGGAKMLNSGGGGAAAPAPQTEGEGIGLGLSYDTKSRWRAGGFGESGFLQDGTNDGRSNDAVTNFAKGAGHRQSSAKDSAAAIQTDIYVENGSIMAGTAYKTKEGDERKKSVGGSNAEDEMAADSVSGQGSEGVRSRLKNGTQKIWTAYQKQREKLAEALGKKTQGQENKQQKGTRRADKEEMLSMQAQNHYLLDSYDRDGNYSMLGKQ